MQHYTANPELNTSLPALQFEAKQAEKINILQHNSTSLTLQRKKKKKQLRILKTLLQLYPKATILVLLSSQ